MRALGITWPSPESLWQVPASLALAYSNAELFPRVMSNKSTQFKDELEIFRTEGDSAVQFFYAWQTVDAVAGSEPSVHQALNRAPLFWNTCVGALQAACLVSIGRVFDPNPDNHSVTRLLNLAHANVAIFSKESLAARKQELDPTADTWLAEYLRDVYVPSGDDFRKLKRQVAVRRRIYDENYRPIRHQLLAHRSASNDGDGSALFAKTNIREMQQLNIAT